MVYLTVEMASLWSALGPAPLDRGRVVQFVSATTGEGTSTVAREFARLAAGRSRRPVWPADADLDDQSQMAAVNAEPERFGRLGRAAGASPDGSIFFGFRPPVRDRDGRPVGDANLLAARPAMDARLWITRLRLDMIGGGRAGGAPAGAGGGARRRGAGRGGGGAPAAGRAGAAGQL